MKFQQLPIWGAYLVETELFSDRRGYFGRAYCRREFDKAGISTAVAQCNISYNFKSHTLRGMHYQVNSHESKFVRCLSGSIFDVLIDLRKDSTTRYRWHGVTLDSDSAAIYIPAGCAHGFMTLEAGTLVYYQTTDFYDPTLERGIRYSDPKFGIKWPYEPSVISDKDLAWEDYDDEKGNPNG